MQQINLSDHRWIPLLQKEIHKVYDLSHAQRSPAFVALFHFIVDELSGADGLPFNTLFSKIAYLTTRHHLQKDLVQHLHKIRMLIDAGEWIDENWVEGGCWALDRLILDVFQAADRPKSSYQKQDIKEEQVDHEIITQERVLITAYLKEEARATVIPYSSLGNEQSILCKHERIAPEFNISLERIQQLKLLPLEAHLVDIHVDAKNNWKPAWIIIEPDYLIDVTAIASCFKGFGVFTADAIINKYLPHSVSKPILIGKSVNALLDGIIKDSEAEFNTLFLEVFKQSPLSFALLSDREIQEISAVCRMHFRNLKQVIKTDFVKVGIEPEQCTLEPSYYSPAYGIQGRLDVLHKGASTHHIIELKSGSPYKANKYGISESHYVQTLLYDLMIKASNPSDIEPTCFILYSKIEGTPLRHAPYENTKITEALLARNRLVVQEKRIARHGLKSLIAFSDIQRHPYIKGFLADHLINFHSVMSTLDPLALTYVDAFSAFVAREHYFSKLGDPSRDRYGYSSLWKDSIAKKTDQLRALNDLTFNRLERNPDVVYFNRRSAQLVQFRSGDIVVLYSAQEVDRPARQLLKGSIISISEFEVVIRLRSTPLHEESWNQHIWCLEPDLIDSQFYQLYKGLFGFASLSEDRRNILLGQDKPEQGQDAHDFIEQSDLTSLQNDILKKMIHAQDYFLLWGPPGTGKTSVMLYAMIRYIIQQTQESILVIAYTNRAVDEICEQLERIDHTDVNDYVRIGSRYACGASYREHLLVEKMDHIKRRSGIREAFQKTRIVVGTLSSISARFELFELKQFDRLIIDEASQILEPHIIGLLSRFKKTVLIGDHLQLPAVSQQSAQSSAIPDDHPLREIGISSLCQSLFTRLLRNAQENKWSHCFDMLQKQGRMHTDVMSFVNKHFYNNKLDIVDHVPSLHERLSHRRAFRDQSSISDVLWNERMIFLDAPVDLDGPSIKVNRMESEIVVQLIKAIRKDDGLSQYSIGVITPFKAQIAQIKKDLVGLELQDITVDTVERYQGSARDIIIISAACNHIRQLSLISVISDGVDKKLNVAMTRAREQVIIIGNKEILSLNPVYKDFISSCEQSI